ncbi:MAG: DUF2238 domain-containing protein [Pseudoxanthomonas sp.]
MKSGTPSRTTLAIATVLLLVALLVSGWHPHERATWWMEVAPVLVVIPALWATHRRFPLTALLYAGIFLHALVLMLGGAYTYARVPLGFWMAELLGLTRNPYDKLGHLMQGLVPALAAREVLLRLHVVHGRRWTAFIVICIVLAISACYEFAEWGTALALGQGADAFLGTQGDPFDTQSDMFCALVGAIAALLFCSRLQDRQIARIRGHARRRLHQPLRQAGSP